jgi:hypothetical protein
MDPAMQKYSKERKRRKKTIPKVFGFDRMRQLLFSVVLLGFALIKPL